MVDETEKVGRLAASGDCATDAPHEARSGLRPDGSVSTGAGPRVYAEGFDENGKWGPALAEAAFTQSGYIVDIGQISDKMARDLNKRAKAGTLVKYRAYWNDALRLRGFGLGPLKTVWALPEIAAAAGITRDNDHG